jgi:hypothetical protein
MRTISSASALMLLHSSRNRNRNSTVITSFNSAPTRIGEFPQLIDETVDLVNVIGSSKCKIACFLDVDGRCIALFHQAELPAQLTGFFLMTKPKHL